MHDCLRFYDILECICQHLASSDSLDALAKLARTCTTFLDPALNALWYTIPSLEPLVRCLPDDAWAVKRSLYRQPVLTLSRQTTSRDWERCRFYAHRIRQYGIIDMNKVDDIRGGMQTDKTFYQALQPPFDLDANQIARPHPLLTLPNLQSCRLLPYTSDPMPHYSPFLSKSLDSLELRLPPTIYIGDITIFGLLRSLPVTSPNLKKLSLYGVDVGPVPRSSGWREDLDSKGKAELNSLLTSALRGLPYLESLDCPCTWFPDEALTFMATRMRLRLLSLKNSAKCISNVLKCDPEENGASVFGYLEDLRIECSPDGGLGEAADLLKRVANASRLKHLDVARPGGIPTESELRVFLQSLSDLTSTISSSQLPLNGESASRVNTNLKTLHIHQGDETGYLLPAERPTPVSKYTNTFSTLAPLLDFRGLSELGILVDTQFSLNDDDALKMASAWPKLNQLELGMSGNGWGRAGEVLTLDGLRAFARHCPDLQELSVSVQIRATTLEKKEMEMERDDSNRVHQVGDGDEKNDDKKVSRCHGLRYLEVGDSIYHGEPECIAVALLDIFPGLCGVSGPNIAVSREWEKKWMQVSEHMNEIQRARRCS